MLRPKSLAGRIMIIVVVCVLMLLIGIGTALQYLMPRYAGSVYDQAEVALNGIAAQVQNAFSSISLDIRELCVDERLQESIRHWQTQDSPAEKMTAEHRIVSMLYNGVASTGESLRAPPREVCALRYAGQLTKDGKWYAGSRMAG